MEFFKFFPTPSDRMGTLWTLGTIKDAYIIEFGPAGTTHFAIEGMMQLNADHDANVYTTHIDETDISFGKQDRLENAILEIDEGHRPKYIFIMASSISAIIGTDIESICFEMQPKVRARLIPITTGGYGGDHTLGIETTLNMLCKEITKPTNNRKIRSYNIIGSNADSFNFLSDVEEVKTMMKEAFDFDTNTVFTAYTSIDEIEEAAEAQINLVFRGEGLKAAKYLEKQYGMNYYYGKPYGLEGTTLWLRGIEESLGIDIQEGYIEKKTSEIRKHLMGYRFMMREKKNKSVILVGDYDTVIGLGNLVEELGLEVDRMFVKHKPCKEIKKNIPEKWEGKLHFDKSERELEDYLKSTPSYLLLADGATLKLENNSRLKLQISNPNLLKHNIYPLIPFVGYNGILYIIQCLFELEKNSDLSF